MRSVVIQASIVALAAASVLAARPARACGGCFAPPTEVTVVTDHRMAFSISPTQSVLWDQIKYSGAPQDFAWVLPVMPGAKVELSHDEFFAALDALSTPTITGPSPSCGSGSSVGCGAGSNVAFSAAGAADNNSVTVVSQGVIGPYDTVTLHATNPNALYDWLTVNSYDIPASTRPVIDAYVTGGFDFIALRLAPGQGVQAMQPVRVVTPGAGLTLPLRMVAAGVGAQVGIMLYVLGEGRYEAQNFQNAVFDESKLVWLHAEARSNYEEVAEQLMQGASGRTWLTEFSQPMALTGSASDAGNGYGCYPQGGGGGAGVYYGQSLASVYFGQCECKGVSACPSPLDAGSPGDAGDAGSAGDAAGDGGLGAPPATCGPCDGFDDLSVALVGMNPATTWVTRMRAILPTSALSEGDLVLQAAAAQAAVSNRHTATVYDDPAYSPCNGNGATGGANGGGGGANGGGGGGGGCNAVADEPDAFSRWLVAGSFVFAGAALARRRRKR
ncbi:MAG TPA: DUF2330 domain-containing protein [Polyangiaceae bacterium]